MRAHVSVNDGNGGAPRRDESPAAAGSGRSPEHGGGEGSSQLRPRRGKMSRREVREHQRARLHAALLAGIAEDGYEALTARSLCARAGVSSRTLYELYGGKERLFLAVHAELSERAARRAEVAWARDPTWPAGLRFALADWLEAIAADPLPARVILLEPYAVGASALAALERMHARFATLMARALEGRSARLTLPSVLPMALQAGIARVIGAALAAEHSAALPALAEPLCAWADCYVHADLAQLQTLLRQDLGSGASQEHWRGQEPERERLLSATVALAGTRGYHGLTVEAICALAETSSGVFHRHFADLEECFLAAYEQVALRALLMASATARGAESWPGVVHRAIFGLARHFARGGAEARVAFVEVFAAGRAGLAVRDRLLGPIGDLLSGLIPPERRPGDVALQATIGAAWGLAQGRVLARRADELTALVPCFSFLALAPVLGAGSALSEIRAEHAALCAAEPAPAASALAEEPDGAADDSERDAPEGL